MLHKAWNSKEEMPYCFPMSSIKIQGHTGQNITDFDPNWAFPDYRPVAAFKSLRFALFFFIYSIEYFNICNMFYSVCHWEQKDQRFGIFVTADGFITCNNDNLQ